MTTPDYLVKGDKMGMVAPARCISFEEVHPSLRLFQKWGLEVELGTHIFNKQNQYAGSDEFRAADLQHMLDNDSIRAVICARGGYGTVRIIDRLDFTRFLKRPKWIIGYSDITVLHSHIQRHFGIETLHATMPVNILKDQPGEDSAETLRHLLFGEKITYTKPLHPFDRKGESEAILTGGNLSILYSLMGSSSEIQTDGKILFIEDVDEYLYHIDRMMMCLKRAGKLAKLKGLIVGGMDRMNDNTIPFGKAANDIILEAAAEYNYPVCIDFPAGHGSKNLALVLGRKIRMKIDQQVELIF
ncbi:MAG: S66 peptidase family protein [Syntrophothermus sp.]